MANPRTPFADFGQFQGSGGGPAPAGAFGTKVAPVAPIAPFNRAAAVASVAPQQPTVSDAAWQAAQDMLGGGVSQGTQKYIRDRAAALGVNLGNVGGDWTTSNALIGELGTSEDRVKAGLNAYNSLLAGTQNLVTDPTQANMFNTELSQWNNTNSAAPDPAAAAQYQKELFDEQVRLLSQAYRNPAAGFRPGSGPLASPSYASVAAGPSISAPGFASPALSPSPTIFSGGRTAPAGDPWYHSAAYYGGAGGGAAPTIGPNLAAAGSAQNQLDPYAEFYLNE